MAHDPGKVSAPKFARHRRYITARAVSESGTDAARGTRQRVHVAQILLDQFDRKQWRQSPESA